MSDNLATADEALDHTAVHEAGHAVAFTRLFPDAMMESVTIVPNMEHGTAGTFRSLDDVDVVPTEMADDDAEDQFFRAAVYACAGYGALIALGWSEEDAIIGCDSDFESALHRLDEGKLAAVALMNEPRNLAAIKLVASGLMKRKTLSGDHVQVLIDVADGATTEDEYAVFLSMLDA